MNFDDGDRGSGVTAQRVAVICTVLNEEGSIRGLLESLVAQSRRPDEIVIVDGGSTDRTVAIVQSFAAGGLPIRLVELPGSNISAGRNAAIAAADAAIIASTDAGVRLAPDWLAELSAPLEHSQGIDVVSGFFAADPRSLFEVAMGATVLPSPKDVDPQRFLPSSRSVAYTREAWSRAGGYPEWLDYCEDLIFDLALRRAGCRFAFAPDALAHFRPRSSLGAFFRQYYRYARGDGKAELWPRRHALRYCSYIVGTLVLLAGFWYKLAWLALVLAGAAYLYHPYRRLWPVLRTYRTMDRLRALLMVPVIRLVGDCAKMVGYPAGLGWRWRKGRGNARP